VIEVLAELDPSLIPVFAEKVSRKMERLSVGDLNIIDVR